MRFVVIATLCFLVASAGWVSGQTVEFDWMKQAKATKANSTEDPTTPSTTTTTTSTTPAPTTEPTTTTTTPTTTTPLPTTTTTSTTTTTAPLPTTTTPRPKPPKAGIWTVVDETTNITCIVVKLGASFVVPYTTESNQVRNVTLNLPSNATSNGTCLTVDGEHQAITLNWLSAPNGTHFNHFTLVFLKNESRVENVEGGIGKDQYAVVEMALTVHPDPVNFPNSTSYDAIDARVGDFAFHPTNLNNTYTCRTEEEVHLNDTKAPQGVVARLRNVQMEAFRQKTDDNFSTASYCSADGPLTSDIVPIAVGCALAALVVIVLIAYLIGRRRARQRGYQSV